jgi:hypothetical protein
MHLSAHPADRDSFTEVNPYMSDMPDMSERSTPVTLRFAHWRGPWSRAIPLALAAALIALPVAANDATPAEKAPNTPTKEVSLRQTAQREAARTPLARTTETRRAQAQAPAAKASGGFFKSGAGAVAIAVMAAGTGFALYSVSHDRITSPAKK